MAIQIKNNIEAREATLLVYDEIGWEVNASDIVDKLTSLDVDTIHVRINSPGGDAFDGIAIMNALRGSSAKVVAVVEGLAASAASIIAVGGSDELIMRPSAELMIHDALAGTYGNAEELRTMISRLDAMSDTIAQIYADKAGGDVDVWREAMRQETWFSADEAVAAGLADRVEDARDVKPAPRHHFKLLNKFAGRRGKPSPELLKSNEVNMNLEELLKAFADQLSKIDERLSRLEPADPEPSGVDVGGGTETPELEPEDNPESVTDDLSEVNPEEDSKTLDVEDTPSNTVTLDIDTFNELKAAAEAGWQASLEAREKALKDEVDTWISEGRISASTRQRALKLINENPDLARETFGSNPKNTIPRREIGHGIDNVDTPKGGTSKLNERADKMGMFTPARL